MVNDIFCKGSAVSLTLYPNRYECKVKIEKEKTMGKNRYSADRVLTDRPPYSSSNNW